MFLKSASAAAYFPGGFGTHDEAMEVLTLVQTGKSDVMPIVFVDAPGGDYWKDWQKYLDKQLFKTGKVSPDDIHLYKITDSAEAAAKEIVEFYRNYHSMRFVKDQLVIRLHKSPSKAILEKLNTEFKDICVKGTIAVQPRLSWKKTDYKELPRISFLIRPDALRSSAPTHRLLEHRLSRNFFGGGGFGGKREAGQTRSVISSKTQEERRCWASRLRDCLFNFRLDGLALDVGSCGFIAAAGG